MELTIRTQGGLAALCVSYTPHDTLDEMVGALHGLTTYDDCRSVRIMEEPEVCELRFEQENGTVNLEVCRRFSIQHQHGQTLLEARGSTLEICLPFWRALRNLQTRLSEKEFELRWGRPFPASGMERLSARLQRLRE